MPVQIELSDEDFETYKRVSYAVAIMLKASMQLYPKDSQQTLAVLAVTKLLSEDGKEPTIDQFNEAIASNHLPLRQIEI